MSEISPRKAAANKLLFATFCSSLAVIAGLLAYAVTNNWLWLGIGALGGTGFALPATISFVRASMEERDRASR